MMYYTSMGGIEAAKSTDGVSFERIGAMVPPGEPGSEQQMVSNPAVIKLSGGGYRMIYEGQDPDRDRRLFSAVSDDGLVWNKEDGVRFADEGDGKPGELFTSVPDIVRLNAGGLRMYYTRGVTSATAISTDEGVTWTKEGDLDLGRIVLDPDVVTTGNGTFVMFFTSFDSSFGVGPQYMMSARSQDGIHFTLDEGKRLEPSTHMGMVVDPDVVALEDGRFRMYYGETEGGKDMRFQILSAVSG